MIASDTTYRAIASVFDVPVLLHELLEQSARTHPTKTAVICGEERASYALLNTLANKFCNELRTRGIQPGNIIALIHENSLEFIAAYFGILKAGAIVAPLNTDSKPESLQAILTELQPRALIASAKQLAKTESFKETVFSPMLVIIGDFGDFPNNKNIPHTTIRRIVTDWTPVNDPKIDISPEAIASIIYTSGSSGRPKGVILTHNNIIANTRSICDCLKLSQNDVQMVVLPFYYVFGLSLLHTHIAIGGTLVLNNQFTFTGTVMQQMINEHVTGFSGVPSTYAYLLHRSPLREMREHLPDLRYCSQAGGHMANSLKLDLRSALPDHTDIVIMYGATEASARLTWLNPQNFLKKIDSIGKEIPDVVIKILDDKGIEVGPGEIGELVADGPNIMQGYFKDPNGTSHVLTDNGYRTGDLGYRDTDGFLFVTGRRDNQLKIGGNRVDPQEIEDIIMESGLMVEVAVIGVPDEILGVVPIALIVSKTRETAGEDLFVFCSARLPHYKVPRYFLPVAALPKNGNGKIDKSECMEMVMQLQKAHDAASQTRYSHV